MGRKGRLRTGQRAIMALSNKSRQRLFGRGVPRIRPPTASHSTAFITSNANTNMYALGGGGVGGGEERLQAIQEAGCGNDQADSDSSDDELELEHEPQHEPDNSHFATYGENVW